jgi:hypothetical protein
MKTMEELRQVVADLQKSAVTKEKAKEILKVALSKSAGYGQRRTGFSYGGGGAEISPNWFMKSEATPIEMELQKKADDIYIVGSLLGVDPRQTKLYRKYSGSEDFIKAMDTTENSDWVPAQLSPRLQEQVHLALKVASLHETIPMPTQPYELPYVAGGSEAYLADEATEEDSARFKKSSTSSGKVTFTAKKIASKVILTEEMNEDSIVPVLPLLKKDIVRALAFAIEDATINGDTSGTHQDSDVTDSRDSRKAWMGYRKLAQADYDFENSLTLTKLRALRGQMGVYGVDPLELALVCSIGGYLQIIDVEGVKTVDKYGPNATILKGELAKIDNIPIVVSEKCRDDLNLSGVYDGSTKTRTSMNLVYRPAMLYGDRRSVTVKTDFDIERDQNILVATQRIAFSRVFASTETFVATGYNFPKV